METESQDQLPGLPTSNSLSAKEFRDAIYSYKESAITDQLYAFGSLLLTEIQDRDKQIDGKAVSVLGWSLAILAFWFTQAKSISGWFDFLIAAGSAIAATLAALFAYKVRQTRSEWKWPSDRDWVQGVRESADDLKRFHVRSMHVVRQSHLTITERKGDWLFWSEKLLVCAAIVLAAGALLKLIIYAVYRNPHLF